MHMTPEQVYLIFCQGLGVEQKVSEERKPILLPLLESLMDGSATATQAVEMSKPPSTKKKRSRKEFRAGLLDHVKRFLAENHPSSLEELHTGLLGRGVDRTCEPSEVRRVLTKYTKVFTNVPGTDKWTLCELLRRPALVAG